MGEAGRISLVLYEENFKEQLMAFQLPPEQAEFTALPSETLDAALSDPDKLAVVIAVDSQAAGFFILHTGKRIAEFYKDYQGAVLVRAFLVDYACQGRGIAKAAMALLPAFVRIHLPAVHEIVLTVNERNLAAGHLYLGAGFRDHGLRRTGSKGPQKILQYDLSLPQENPDEDILLRERLTGIFSRNRLLMDIFRRARFMEPFPYYIGAGCLVQTVWNELTGRAPEYGIGDIDLIYFDPEDLSFAAEDQLIAKGRECFSGIPIPVDIKNQARVHLWYEERFGVRLQPYPSLEAAIDSWPTTVTALGARLDGNGEWHIYAPFGLKDLFSLTLRPNKVLISEEIYRSKTLKWQKKWPELQIMPWED